MVPFVGRLAVFMSAVSLFRFGAGESRVTSLGRSHSGCDGMSSYCKCEEARCWEHVGEIFTSRSNGSVCKRKPNAAIDDLTHPRRFAPSSPGKLLKKITVTHEILSWELLEN